MIRLVIRRLWRRLKWLLSMRRITWEYESCIVCGRSFRIGWDVRDHIWQAVMDVKDGSGGSLCVDCFVERAEAKGVKFKSDDFDMYIFTPEE